MSEIHYFENKKGVKITVEFDTEEQRDSFWAEERPITALGWKRIHNRPTPPVKKKQHQISANY